MIIIYGIVLMMYFALFLLAAGRRPPPLESGRKPGLFDKAADYIYGFAKKGGYCGRRERKKAFRFYTRKSGREGSGKRRIFANIT